MTNIISIPPEILIDVFALLAHDAQDAFVQWLTATAHNRLAHNPLPYSWIRVTHVCCSWRTLALQSSSLWSHISLTGEERDFEMAAHAGSQPLTVAVSWANGAHVLEPVANKAPIQRLEELLTMRAHQIQTLIMPKWDSILVQVSSRASQLRKLVFVEPSLEHPINDPPQRAWAFPRLEELRSASSLRHSLVAICFPTLRTLVLHPDYTTRGLYLYYFTDPSELAEALCNTPLLESLDVALATSYEQATKSVSEPSLPHLHSLRLTGSTRSCASLFRHLKLPREARIDIQRSAARGHEGSWSSLGNMLGILEAMVTSDAWECARTSPFEPILMLRITFNHLGCTLSGWRGVQTDPVGRAYNDINPDVRLAIDKDSSTEDAVTLLSAIPLQDLEVLHVGRVTHARRFLPYLKGLSTLASLRVLVLHSVPPAAALELMATTTARDIWLVAIIFREPKESGQNDVTEMPQGGKCRANFRTAVLPKPINIYTVQSDNKGTAQDLVDVCARRGASGLGFSHIFIDDGENIDEEHVSALRELPCGIHVILRRSQRPRKMSK